MGELKKKYGLITAICMVAGIVIGSGVFFKAQTILQKTEGNMIYGVISWIIGGVIMLCCILAFSVMAQNYEKVNGVVDYAEATVGSKYGYFVGWFMSIIYYPTLTSVLAWLSARYSLEFICSVNKEFAMHINALEGGCVFGPECFVLACFFLVADFAMNALSPKLAGKFQVSATFIKLIPLVLMAVVGTIYGLTHAGEGIDTHILAANFSKNTGGDAAILFTGVVATSFAYEGWVIATAINSELKNSKRNLPIALVLGGVIVVAVYLFYFVGVAGVVPVDTLIDKGAPVAFVKLFGNVFGNILNLFIAISCMGTLNGLMVGCTRGIYSIATRGYGFKPAMFKEVDRQTNMPANSSIIGLLLCSIWLVFFFGANLAKANWFGFFGFDSSELPIVTTYLLYIPIFIAFMKKAKSLSAVKRFFIPVIAIFGSLFMVIAAVYAHGISPYKAAAAEGHFSCPIIGYLVVFAVIMLVGACFSKKRTKFDNN